MKEFALNVWNMPGDEFFKWLLITGFALFLIYEAVIEVNTRRVVRFTKRVK